MMQTVNVSMQGIVNQSAEMRGIVALIDSVAFQTNMLALNAASTPAFMAAALPSWPKRWGCWRKRAAIRRAIFSS